MSHAFNLDAYACNDERSLPFAFQLLLLGLALFKAAKLRKLHGLNHSQLAFIMVKDQALYVLL